MTETEKSLHIADVRAYMQMEGLPFTQENEDNIRDVLDGRITADDMIEHIIRKYKK